MKVYLNDIKRFWRMDYGQVDQWLSAIERGESPDLDRFAPIRPTPWMIALWWLVIAWPVGSASLFAYIGRTALRRKGLFVIAGVLAGYATLILLYWVAVPSMVWLATLGDSTGGLVLVLLTYLPVILALAAPTAVVFGVFKYFSSGDHSAG